MEKKGKSDKCRFPKDYEVILVQKSKVEQGDLCSRQAEQPVTEQLDQHVQGSHNLSSSQLFVFKAKIKHFI